MSNVWERNKILLKSDELAHEIFRVARSFPRSEIYGLTSQLRRAALSVPLNIIEGYSRFKPQTHIHFLEIAFGSLKETHYLVEFSYKEKLMTMHETKKLLGICIEIEKMLYAKLRTMKNKG